MVQSAALSSGVSIRTLTAKPVATKPYYFEMPFDDRGRRSLLLSAGFLRAAGAALANHQRGRFEACPRLGQSAGGKFHMTPGTSVTGTFTITTFFTNAADGAAGSRSAGRTRR